MTQEDDSGFETALAMIAEAAAAFRDPWRIIGSAAAILAGADAGVVRDIDLLLSMRDIAALKARWRALPASGPAPSATFRSAAFHRFETPFPVEAMAGFEIRTAQGDWVTVEPKTRIRRGRLFIPSVAEQIEILRLMGREKDAPRIAALARLL